MVARAGGGAAADARGAGHRLRPVQPARQGVPDRQIDANTTFEKNDFRNIVPRFSAEARQANQALVDLLGGVAKQKNAPRRRRSRSPGCSRRSPGSCRSRARRSSRRLEENLGAAARAALRPTICGRSTTPPRRSRCRARAIPSSSRSEPGSEPCEQCEKETTMRGAVIYGKRDVRFEERAAPTIVEPTDAVIKMAATCVCGSDLWPYRGIKPVKEPTPIGHEYCGIVEEVGRAVTSVKPGQFVIGSFFASDNTCPHCQAGYQTSCQHRELVAGAQAPLLRVPLADGTLVATPGGSARRSDPELAGALRRARHGLVRRRRGQRQARRDGRRRRRRRGRPARACSRPGRWARSASSR